MDAGATFIFDGDCGFCTRSAEALERWARPRARVVPWQWTDLARLGVTEQECSEAVQWVEGREVDGRGRHSAGPVAIADALRTSPRSPWRWVGWVLGTRAVGVLAWPIYRWVARHRHQLPGGTPACRIPQDHPSQHPGPSQVHPTR